MELLPQEREIKKEVSALVVAANSLVVATQGQAEEAVSFVRGANSSIKKIKAFFLPMKTAANEAHKAVVGRESETLAIPEQAKTIVNGKLTEYNRNQERIRLEAEAKARDKARKEYDKQLAKAIVSIGKIMERSTSHSETIELLNMELKRDDLTDIEIQKIEAQIDIEQAMLDNNTEQAEEMQARAEQPIYVEPVILPTTEKVAGMVTKQKIEMQIINPVSVVKAIGEGVLPISCVKLNEAEIKKHIMSFKDQRRTYPGINYRIVSDTHTR